MQDELLRPIADAAAANGMGLLAGCLVWRASADYLARLGGRDLAAVNQRAVERTRAFIDEWRARSEAARATPVIITGDIGPRGDGYAVSGPVSAGAAYDYHAPQIEVLARTGVDLLLPLTMTSVPEQSASCAPPRAPRCPGWCRRRSSLTAASRRDAAG